MKTLHTMIVLTIACTVSQAATAQPPLSREGMRGPWNNDVLVYRVSRGGEVTKTATFERAGVPTLARLKDGRLIAAHQHFPQDDEASFDKVAVRFSADDGKTWTRPQVIRMAGLPEGMRFPFDPSLVPLPDGRVRLYFTSLRGRRFEEDVPAIYSALSDNGVAYTFESGMRFGVEGRIVIDCAVVLHQGVFHLYAPDNGSQRHPGQRFGQEPAGMRPRPGVGYHATSNDGLKFTRAADVRIEGRRRWLGNVQSDGSVITFIGTGDPGEPGFPGGGQPHGGLWMAVSSDGESWKLIRAPQIPVADPGAAAARDGGWVVVGTGPPRRGTPGAEERPNAPTFGQPPGPPRPPGPPPAGRPFAGPFLPGPPAGPGGDGPWNHRVLLATSKDGLSWTVGSQVLAERASVPELFAGPDGQPIVLFVDASGRSLPGTLGAMVQNADGSWVRKPTNLRGADPNVVQSKDGNYRGYTKGRDGAIIVFSSRDGLQWERLGEAFRDERYPQSTDSDVFETPDGWVMLISLGPRLLRCVSADGLKFTAGEILDLGGSVSDTVNVEGGWRTFFHVNATPRTGGKMLIRSAFTRDGRTWKVEEGDRVLAPADGPAKLGVADPAPVKLKDGSWLMAVKSFIEPTGSAQFSRSPGGPPVSPRELDGTKRESAEGGEASALPPRPAPPRGFERGFEEQRRNPSPQPGGPGPSLHQHQVLSASSKQGLTWTRDEGVRLSGASVPCVINDADKRVLMYFVQPPDKPGKPETVACAVSTDGMNFEPASAFRIEGLSTLKAVDPSILKDDAGKFHLYYLASNHRGDPAAGANPHAIHLALSDDGICFRETCSVFEHADLVDPDVFRFKDQWFMYVFARRATIIATSTDGKKFTYARELSPAGWGTTAPLALADGRLRLYAFDQRTPIGNAVRSFISTDGLNWTAESGERLRANADEQITDPFVVSWRGGFRMYFKTSPARTRNVAAERAAAPRSK